jgi:phosphate transport system permease protein
MNSYPKRKKRTADTKLKILIWFFSFITIGIVASILTYIVINGIGYINWEFVSTINKPFDNLNGILPMIVSTLYIILLTVAISTPIGICSAIYLVEYSKPGRLLSIIRFTTETLAGIPSIIYGLFGLLFFNTIMKLGYSLLSGALTLSIMVLPTIIRTTEEALKAVPVSYKEGSLALGATKLRTISKVILPCAIPGILTAVILSIGRIVGETAALIFTSGMVPEIPRSILNSGRTLALHLYYLASTGTSFEQAFATATILILIVVIINLLASSIASGLKRMTMGK